MQCVERPIPRRMLCFLTAIVSWEWPIALSATRSLFIFRVTPAQSECDALIFLRERVTIAADGHEDIVRVPARGFSYLHTALSHSLRALLRRARFSLKTLEWWSIVP